MFYGGNSRYFKNCDLEKILSFKTTNNKYFLGQMVISLLKNVHLDTALLGAIFVIEKLI